MDKDLKTFATKHDLTWRQAKFVLRYTGNGTQAARQAGYTGNDATLAVQASRLLSKDKIIRALDSLAGCQSASDALSPTLLTRNDLMAIWSELATDATATWKDRLKAMDSLAKAQGIFIDRSQVISNVRIESLDKLSDQELYAKLDVLLEDLQAGGVRLALPERTSVDS